MLVLWTTSLLAAGKPVDPHYTRAGFFDLHICNWPERNRFFLAVFSTRTFKDVSGVEVFRPDGKRLEQFDLNRFRIVNKPGKPEKRVILNLWSIPKEATEGWYTANIRLKNGEEIVARDYVRFRSITRATHLVPSDGAVNVQLPLALHWDRIDGAAYYRVFIKDLWDAEKVIFKSKLLTEPGTTLPAGLLQPGGAYAWRVHARDVDGDPMTGDFNHGSLSQYIEFSVAP